MGARPVVNVFARELTDDLAGLVKKLDKKVTENADSKMGGFLVLLSEDPDADEAKIEAFAKKHGISDNFGLTLYDGPAGPPRYKIAENADLTVMMWAGRGKNVKYNFASESAKIDDKQVDSIVKATAKILP